MDEAKIANFTMVQEVISRMASHSISLKSLAATVVAAIIALAASQDGHPGTVALMSLLPLVTFWVLDAYYLRIEKAYRGLWRRTSMMAGAFYLLSSCCVYCLT